MTVQKYRKKPVEVEAMHYNGTLERAREIEAWSGNKFQVFIDQEHWCTVSTLEGILRVKPGSYIIKGVKGEFYPCQADIFEATYDLVS